MNAIVMCVLMALGINRDGSVYFDAKVGESYTITYSHDLQSWYYHPAVLHYSPLYDLKVTFTPPPSWDVAFFKLYRE